MMERDAPVLVTPSAPVVGLLFSELQAEPCLFGDIARGRKNALNLPVGRAEN